MRRRKSVWAGLWFAVAMAAGCSDSPSVAPAPSTTTSSAGPTDAAGSATPGQAAAPSVVTNRSGSAIAITMANDALLVASEDHRALFRVALPFTASSKVDRIDMPGAPAQVVALADRVLVTIRDPGLLLELVPNEAGKLVEKRRVDLAADAWGLGVTPSGSSALVSSAWTHTVSVVDLATMKLSWSAEVAREPRGVMVMPDGQRAYVSHLIGTALTRIDGISSNKPAATTVELRAAPSRTPFGKQLSATMGYALASDPGGKRLFAPRHALGALATWSLNTSWWGAPTVDVLLTSDDSALAPAKNDQRAVFRAATPGGLAYQATRAADSKSSPLPEATWDFAPQPRAAVYRNATHTLLVASEGNSKVVEFDARALEPALFPLRIYDVQTSMKKPFVMPQTGGAPNGIVLDSTASKMYVFGRSTYDVTEVALAAPPGSPPAPEAELVTVSLAEDPLLEDAPAAGPKRKAREMASWGRRLFYMADDHEMSSGMACAGCHPEGRDDGFTWRLFERRSRYSDKSDWELDASVDAFDMTGGSDEQHTTDGWPRQTPMLAGRVMAVGPYGWTGESETLEARVVAGFGLHHAYGEATGHALLVASFLRMGLTPPPKVTRQLTPEEERGKVVFASDETGCSGCHDPTTRYTDMRPVAVKVPDRPGYDREEGVKFKTPSLLWVVGTPPYFHNASAPTLEALIVGNNDKMGKTNQLSTADRTALVAFLKTL